MKAVTHEPGNIDITIKNMTIDGHTAVKIMKCLKEHEPEIWKAMREAITIAPEDNEKEESQ